MEPNQTSNTEVASTPVTSASNAPTVSQPVTVKPNNSKRNLIIACVVAAIAIVGVGYYIHQRNNSPEAQLANLLNNLGNGQSLDDLSKKIIEDALKEAGKETYVSSRTSTKTSSRTSSKSTSTTNNSLPSDLPSAVPIYKPSRVVSSDRHEFGEVVEYLYSVEITGQATDDLIDAYNTLLIEKGWTITEDSPYAFFYFQAEKDNMQITLNLSDMGETNEAGERQVTIVARLVVTG